MHEPHENRDFFADDARRRSRLRRDGQALVRARHRRRCTARALTPLARRRHVRPCAAQARGPLREWL